MNDSDPDRVAGADRIGIGRLLAPIEWQQLLHGFVEEDLHGVGHSFKAMLGNSWTAALDWFWWVM